MQTIETTGVIAADHTLTVQLPDELSPGAYRVTVTVEPLPRTGKPDIMDGWIMFPGKLTDPTDTFRRETLYDE